MRGPSARVATLAAVLAAAVPAMLGAAGRAARPTLCSLVPVPSARDPQGPYFVASALAETTLAGPGAVKPSRYGGHWGPGRERVVYGQLVRVDMLGGLQAAALRRAFERAGSREAVVVPWDYDPACEPTYWSRSARWVEPGLVGFYSLRLRPESLWADGRPTLDAFAADLEPYPHGAFFRAGHRGTDALRARPSLDAREMFFLYEALPTYEEAERRAPEALSRLRSWAAANPALARKYPADEILAWILRPRDGR